PSTARPRVSISPATPSVRSRASAPGLTVSPHSLSRGNLARSRIVTRTPARASSVPAQAPAGPPPTIRTSGSPNDDRAVLGSETEAVAERRLALRASAVVWNHVEVAGRTRLDLVDRRRQDPARQRQRRGYHAGRAGGALRMADHRFHGRSGEPIGVGAEDLPHAPRLDRVVQLRR